jgi:NAD(P)-dependent dehydrogenase (short-subunit alcohol dehydrogenase family)
VHRRVERARPPFRALLARHGADVVVGRAPHRRAGRARGRDRALGRKAYVVPLDVRDAASVDAAVAPRRAGRRIDILVNNAGVALTKPALQTSDEEWRSVVDTNLDGAFRSRARRRRRWPTRSAAARSSTSPRSSACA